MAFLMMVKKNEILSRFIDTHADTICELWYNMSILMNHLDPRKNRKTEKKMKLKMAENNTYNFSNGIYEITYTDNHDVETSIMATTSPDSVLGTPTGTPTKHTVWVFNVNAEGWESIVLDSIINTEQLTGVGAKNNQKKLQVGSEYFGQISLFDDDLDSQEHPDQ